MKFSIRLKLILAISLLMVVIFSIAANLFINEKKQQLTLDIYENMSAFSRLTALNIANDYDLYLAENGFIYFNREIRSLFEQVDYLGTVKLVNYSGELLYDSKNDAEKQYDGEIRKIKDETLLRQIKSENPSFKTLNGPEIFLNVAESGEVNFVDEQGKKTFSTFVPGTLIEYFVVPAGEKYAVIYDLKYDLYYERIDEMIRRISYLATFAVMLGMILAMNLSRALTKPIAKLVGGVNEISKGNFDTQVEIKTHDEVRFLGDAFNKMARDLKASLEARIYKERVTHELKLAAEIQQRIIPKEIPRVKGLDISAGVIPATEIGGDMYDFITEDDSRMLLYLGDVTGHGVPAGIVSSTVNALFYGYSEIKDLKDLIVRVNRVLKAKSMPNMFMTLCLMEWIAAENKMRYVNAGHEKIIHYVAKEKKIHLEGEGGIALGMVKDIDKLVKINETDLEIGDFLVLYSDGIPECWNGNSETYGMDRFVKAVEGFGDLENSTAIKRAILADVSQFAQGFEQKDDITLIVIKRVA